MKKKYVIALEAAFAVIENANEQNVILGMEKFQELQDNDSPLDESLSGALNQVAADGGQWLWGQEVFFETLEKLIVDAKLFALHAAVSFVTTDENVYEECKTIFLDNITVDGEDQALATALDHATADGSLWTHAQDEYYLVRDNTLEELESEDETVKHVNPLRAAAIILLAFICALIVVAGVYYFQPKPETTATTPATTEASTETTTEAIDETDKVAKTAEVALAAAGWKVGEYTIGNVDESIDKSTAANGAFSKDGVKSPSQMVAWLKADSAAAKALIGQINKEIGSIEGVYDAKNWTVIQSQIDFTYPGNTLFKNGVVVSSGVRSGGKGDIFLMFVSPYNGAYVIVRGACVNPQMETPIPETTPPPYLQPKSPNPADYKYPAGKPVVPLVVVPAEVVPPTVITEVEGPSGIEDEATNNPGSESGVTAPGATPAVEDRAEDVIAPEKKVNPVNNDETNVTDPGMPPGF